MMVWAGNPLRVKVIQSVSGKHDPGFGRDVYAIQDKDGDVSVLVVDDDGHLSWVARAEFTVIGGKRMG
ncbi:MAG TPA: hypothetical protein VKW09_05430 [bacterium]|nr:hypothetical protein [bacterium]